MISVLDRTRAVELIEDAVMAGALAKTAGEELQISQRTYQRWRSADGPVTADGRPQAERPQPANTLSAQEQQQILAICNQPEYSSLPPSQIVPALADHQRDHGEDQAILAKRKELYEAAKERKPERWSGPTRNWEPAGEVWLNPENSEKADVGIRENSVWKTRQLS